MSTYVVYTRCRGEMGAHHSMCVEAGGQPARTGFIWGWGWQSLCPLSLPAFLFIHFTDEKTQAERDTQMVCLRSQSPGPGSIF